jgi:glycosyltransferase involved in cell wall biosynthesis
MSQDVAGAGAAPEGFSVVLPALDEEGGLVATLDALRAALHGARRPHEVIVVDDGSRDATPRLLAAQPDLTVVRHATTRGYGAALKTGIAAARHPLVVVMDADGTYTAAAIPALVDDCAGVDMVVGARTGAQVHASPARSIAKWGFRQFAQWLTGRHIPDLNSGLRVFRRTLAQRYLDVLPDGFSFTTTITVAALAERFAVRFASVDYLPRIGRSKVRPIPDTLRIARQLLRLGLRFAPLRTALALTLPLFAVGAAAMADGAAALGSLAWLTSGVAVVLGARAEQRARRRRDPAVGDQVPAGRG